MIRGKFGDAIRSKSDAAMVNEALCKILCHNICCLISSTFELGIEATYWGEGAEESNTTAEGAAGSDPVEAWAWV